MQQNNKCLDDKDLAAWVVLRSGLLPCIAGCLYQYENRQTIRAGAVHQQRYGKNNILGDFQRFNEKRTKSRTPCAHVDELA